MNRARVAALLRELAEAVESDDVPEEAPSQSRVKNARRPRTLVRPPGEAPPDVAGRAARILRDRGLR